ncbi:MAG: hypothetical protein V2A53_06170 [bacterium]
MSIPSSSISLSLSFSARIKRADLGCGWKVRRIEGIPLFLADFTVFFIKV